MLTPPGLWINRYRDWPDAIVAYNWGIGKFDAWVKAGRPVDGLIPGVAVYLGRVLHDSGLCRETSTVPTRPMAPSAPGCADLGAWPGLIGNGQFATGAVSTPFYSQLDRALHLSTIQNPRSRTCVAGRRMPRDDHIKQTR